MKKGFTLLEILLVIAAIGILAAIVIVAINPQRQLDQVRDAERQSDLNNLNKALSQYLIDNGAYPEPMNTMSVASQEICNPSASDCSGKLDLTNAIAPTYLAQIPTSNSPSVTGSGYYITRVSPTEYDVHGLDRDVQTYIERVLSNGGTISDEHIGVINRFVHRIKRADVWTQILELGTFTGNNLAGAQVKLKSAPSASPYFRNLGYEQNDYNPTVGMRGNDSNDGFCSDVDLTQEYQGPNSVHFGVYTNPHTTIGLHYGGLVDPSNRGIQLYFTNGQSRVGLFSSNWEAVSGDTFPGGMILGTRTNSTIRLYYNDELKTTDSSLTSTENISYAIFDICMGARGLNSTYQVNQPHIYQFMTLGYDLSENQYETYNTEIQQLIELLGRDD